MKEYIEREAVIKAILDARRAWSTSFIDIYDALAGLQAIPKADVQPVVRGCWKDAIQSCHDSPHVKCSVCGEYYWRYFNKFNYCPICGADMRDNRN